MASEPLDIWAAGDSYEPYVGRWSRIVAREFLSWVGAPAHAEWLDVGCGTGALCEAILRFTSPRQVTAIDPSEGFLSYARNKVADPRSSFQVGDAQALPVPDGFGIIPNVCRNDPARTRGSPHLAHRFGVVRNEIHDEA